MNFKNRVLQSLERSNLTEDKKIFEKFFRAILKHEKGLTIDDIGGYVSEKMNRNPDKRQMALKQVILPRLKDAEKKLNEKLNASLKNNFLDFVDDKIDDYIDWDA